MRYSRARRRVHGGGGVRDQVVVTIEPTTPSARLDVADAFQQVLDYLRLIELAASDHAKFDWKLEKAATNSPFTVVAYTPTGGVAAKHQQSLPVAQRRTEEGLRELAKGTVPSWMHKEQRNTAKRLTRRFTSGIGRVQLRSSETDKRSFSVNRSLAGKALQTLERVDGIDELNIPAHTAYGEIEGTLMGVGTHYNKPALWVRANGFDIIRCLIEREKLDELGDEATLSEVWQHKRVRLSGKLYYDEGGLLGEMAVDGMSIFAAPGVHLQEIITPGFTGDFDPVTFLDRLHEGNAH